MTQTSAATLVWFRHDLRIDDNAALQAAIERGQPLVPLYILDVNEDPDWPIGGASRWWLHHALHDLDQQLNKYGLSLVLVEGDTHTELNKWIQSTGAHAVYWNRRYEPAIIERDKQLKQELQADGIDAKSFNSALLFEPHTIQNKSGDPYKVFTPYWRYCRTLSVPAPVKTEIKQAKSCNKAAPGLKLADLKLLPDINWDAVFYHHWTPTVAAARQRLKKFVQDPIDDYDRSRDIPEEDGTSRLSPYLHFGQIGPRQIWAALSQADKVSGKDAECYWSEIGWREFSYHLLYHFPYSHKTAFRPEYDAFPWQPNEDFLAAWQQGQTGYPIVDAGMRQLWSIGWMHNRVRMIVASLLVKHLLQPWQDGAAWFWDTLVDADLASNSQGWQWTAGSGADASPYFRIFNPITQGEKFDPEGAYVRHWVPELKDLPASSIHQPWKASSDILQRAKVHLGKDYPEPIIKHIEGRGRALQAYEKFKGR